MKFKINIDQNAAINIANENYGEQIVEIALENFEPNELKFIAGQWISDGLCKIKFYDGNKLTADGNFYNDVKLFSYPVFAKIENPVIMVKEIIEKSLKNKIAIENETLREFEEKVEKLYLKVKDLDFCHPCDFIDTVGAGVKNKHPELVAKLIKNYDENQEKIKERQKLDAQERAKKELKQKNDLKNWALTHGSEKTKLMIKNEFETWSNSAQKDFVQHIIDTRLPDFTIGAGDGQSRKAPTLEELQAFDFVVELAKNEPTLFDSPQIERITIEANDDNDYQESHETEVQVKIICLDGSTHWISKTM